MFSLKDGDLLPPFHDLQGMVAQLLKTSFFCAEGPGGSWRTHFPGIDDGLGKLRGNNSGEGVWVAVSQDSALLIGSCGNNVVLLCVPETSRNAKSIQATSGWYTKKAVQRRH